MKRTQTFLVVAQLKKLPHSPGFFQWESYWKIHCFSPHGGTERNKMEAIIIILIKLTGIGL